MKSSELIFIGIKGSVIALNRANGEEKWVRRLKGYDFVNIVLENNRILATTYGEIFCLDAVTGDTLWHNRLKGYGIGLATIATSNGSGTAPILAEKRRQDEAASAAAATTATNA